jgi:hypothetical protein
VFFNVTLLFAAVCLCRKRKNTFDFRRVYWILNGKKKVALFSLFSTKLKHYDYIVINNMIKK